MYSLWCPETFEIVRRKICPLVWSEEPRVLFPVWNYCHDYQRDSVHWLFLRTGWGNVSKKRHIDSFPIKQSVLCTIIELKKCCWVVLYMHIIYICIKRYGRNFCFWLNIYDTVWSAFLQPFSWLRDLADLQLSVNGCWIKKLCNPLEWNSSTPPQSPLFIFPVFPCLIHYLFSFSQRCHTQE